MPKCIGPPTRYGELPKPAPRLPMILTPRKPVATAITAVATKLAMMANGRFVMTRNPLPTLHIDKALHGEVWRVRYAEFECVDFSCVGRVSVAVDDPDDLD